jgi:hypothetical protein
MLRLIWALLAMAVMGCDSSPTSHSHDLTPEAEADVAAGFEDGSYPHEGRVVNGLRFEVEGDFVAERWPQLQFKFTFHNESDKDIVINTYGLYHDLTCSRISPTNILKVSTHKPKPYCPRGPLAKDLKRIPSNGTVILKREHSASSIDIPFGKLEGGKVIKQKIHYSYAFGIPGTYSIAFVYNVSNPNMRPGVMSKFLRSDEQIWAGVVYSNPVKVNVKLEKASR